MVEGYKCLSQFITMALPHMDRGSKFILPEWFKNLHKEKQNIKSAPRPVVIPRDLAKQMQKPLKRDSTQVDKSPTGKAF